MTLKCLREKLLQVTQNKTIITLKDKHGEQINTRKHLPEDFNDTEVIAWSIYSGDPATTLASPYDYLTATLDIIIPPDTDEHKYEINYTETYEDSYTVMATNKDDAILTFQEKLLTGEFSRPQKCTNKVIMDTRKLT